MAQMGFDFRKGPQEPRGEKEQGRNPLPRNIEERHRAAKVGPGDSGTSLDSLHRGGSAG